MREREKETRNSSKKKKKRQAAADEEKPDFCVWMRTPKIKEAKESEMKISLLNEKKPSKREKKVYFCKKRQR